MSFDYDVTIIGAGPIGSTLAYELAKEPKELYIIEEAGHFDFYANEKYINMAIDKLIGFFNKYL
ncbi:MAG: NAD(P)-binding protein [Methanobrevibacter sp.]|nr:NAD(P)-binding protein [Methanobrevibacter sp.]